MLGLDNGREKEQGMRAIPKKLYHRKQIIIIYLTKKDKFPNPGNQGCLETFEFLNRNYTRC